MKPSFFSRNPLLSWLLGASVVSCYWFYILMDPWLGFINSDGAIPFQVLLEPWMPQDVFYWGTSRMGMLYELVWKAGVTLLGLREALRGAMVFPELFYLGHVFAYFFGLVFWLISLRSTAGRLVFCAFFLPLTHIAMNLNLTPGQPYGIVFLLNGLFFWVIARWTESDRKQIALSCLVGAMYIQHELAALILFAVFSAQFLKRVHERGEESRWLSPLVLVVWVATGLYFKSRSNEWISGPSHYGMTDWSSFFHRLRATLFEGKWFYGVRRGTGHVLTLAVVVYVLEIFRTRRYRTLFRDPEQVLFFGTIFGFMMIQLSQWFVSSHRDPRYFTNLVPLLIWSFLRRLEWAGLDAKKWLRRQQLIYFAACVIPLWSVQNYQLWANPIGRALLVSPAHDPADLSVLGVRDVSYDVSETLMPSEIRDSWMLELLPGWIPEAERLLVRGRVERLSRAILAAGCGSYVDDYWSSHILVPATAGKITAGAGTHIRNPMLFKRILAARPLCVMPRKGTPFQNYISGLNCKNTPIGFLVCSEPTP